MYRKNFLVDDEGRKRTMYNRITSTTKITVTARKRLANQLSLPITVYRPAMKAKVSEMRAIPRSGITILREKVAN
jgi:hypothetical protein